MSGSISMKWAMVCSVDDASLIPKLEEFGIWLCETLGNESEKLLFTHQFDYRPEIVLHVAPSDYDAFVAAYEKIATECPGVMVIFQILPTQKSVAYTWMKKLSNQFGKIRQGIILENALSRFADHDLHEVLVNILHWISRNIATTISQKENHRPCNLRVGPSKETTLPPNQILRMNGVENAVQAVIHSCVIVDREWPISSVKVSGFPSTFNQYQLAALFYNFNVVAVHFEDDFAIVCFVNKFHAVQVAMLFDNLQLDVDHLLKTMGMVRKLYRRADILYGKCEDSPTVVEAVQFHGIKRTKSDALVKEIAHLYKCSDFGTLIHDANLAAKHLVEVGLMENATALIDVCKGNPHSYVVSFVVKEPSVFAVGAKAGVSTYGEADAILNVNKRSVFGRGETFNASYTYTVKGNQIFNFSLAKPMLGWQKYAGLNLAVFRNLFMLPWNTSETAENGIVMQYNNLINKNMKHTTNINLIWRKFMPLKDTSFTVREFAGHSLKFSMENSIAYDTRDYRLLPSGGLYCRVSQELAGLLGDVCFAKQQLDLQAAVPLWLGAFICGSFQGSLLSPFAERPAHLLDRLYLGGPLNLRGFSWNSLGPKAGIASLGGIASCAAALHIYRPLIPADLLFAHAYIVAGSLLPSNSFSKLKDFIDEGRVSAGIGITFVFQDMVRLELNYALPLRYRSTDSCSSGIQFGAGINFL